MFLDFPKWFALAGRVALEYWMNSLPMLIGTIQLTKMPNLYRHRKSAQLISHNRLQRRQLLSKVSIPFLIVKARPFPSFEKSKSFEQ